MTDLVTLSEKSYRDLVHTHSEFRAAIRVEERELVLTRAEIEQDVTEQAGDPKALGANESERSRRLLLAVHHSERYERALAQLDGLRWECDRYAAELDARREDRKQRYVTALERAGADMAEMVA